MLLLIAISVMFDMRRHSLLEAQRIYRAVNKQEENKESRITEQRS